MTNNFLLFISFSSSTKKTNIAPVNYGRARVKTCEMDGENRDLEESRYYVREEVEKS